MQPYILSAVRTPHGKFLGALADIAAPRLGAVAVHVALGRAAVKADMVDEVIMGHVLQAGVGQNPARQAALLAGLPDTVSAFTVNKVCGSGLKAIALAAQAVMAGDAQVIVAGGMESMSRAPYLLPNARTGLKYGDQPTVDALIRDGLWCPFENWPMGDAAEHTATQCGITRAAQDRYAAASHQRAAAAWERGDFAAEIAPISLEGKGGRSTVSFGVDEGIRANSTAESLAALKPAFQKAGTVTAGNASQLSDGAAAVVVATERAAEQIGTPPLARIVAYATSGVAPKDLFLAPATAIPMVLAKANWSLNDVDLFELNEAFAAQMLACVQKLGLDEAKVNVNGGAIALGHPIGASGARVLVTLVHALHNRGLKRGVACLCLGGGNAIAMAIERV